MKKRLLVIGAGGLAPEIEEMAGMLGYHVVGYLDDAPEKARCQPVLGAVSEFEAFAGKVDGAIVALGNNAVRLKLTERLLEAGFVFPTLIHPTAYVSPDAVLGEGCVIRANAVVSRYVRLGKACLINVGALIDHDCVLGDGVHAAMGCVIRGEQILPPLTHVPAGTVVEETT